MPSYQATDTINASVKDVFAFVDDHAHLSSHMSQSSWIMGGGSMRTTSDQHHGQKLGSHIRLQGTVFGLKLFLDEVITEYHPPRLKAWKTVGDIRLLVIGHYRMKLALTPLSDHTTQLTVAIDYDLPATPWLGKLLGPLYARWCVHRMLRDTANNFT
jgi:hypothetical protein